MPLRSLKETERYLSLVEQKNKRRRYVGLPKESDPRPEVTLSDRIRKTGVRIDNNSFQLEAWLPYEIPGLVLDLPTPVTKPQEETVGEKPLENIRDSVEFSQQFPKIKPKPVSLMDILRIKNSRKVTDRLAKLMENTVDDNQKPQKQVDTVFQSDINRIDMSEEGKPINPEQSRVNVPEPEQDFNKEDYIKIPKIMSRRQFLTGASLLAGSMVVGGILSKLGILKPAAETLPNPSETIAPGNENIDSDKSESDLSLKEYGLKWAPDGHIAFYTTPEGKKRYFVSAAVSTWMIETDGKKTLKDYILSKELNKDRFHEVLVPTRNFESETDYKNGYTGITSIIQVEKDKNPNHLIATTHYEQRKEEDDSDSYTASVGLVESFDGGFSWQDKRVLLRGRVHEQPGNRITGAGQPAAIVKDGFLHILYIEWGSGADQLYGAKMKINSDGSLGELENIVDENGDLKPMISVPSGQGYAALPSLSYNDEIGKYLCIIETAQGFCETTSTDLVNWSEAKLIFKYEDHNSVRRGMDLEEGQQFLTYPTLLDESRKDDHTTGKNGILYFASRPQGMNSHNLKSIDVNLTA